MSYPKNYKRSKLYKEMPDISEGIIGLQEGQVFKVKAFDAMHAIRLRYAMYGFINAFFNKAESCFEIEIGGDKQMLIITRKPILKVKEVEEWEMTE